MKIKSNKKINESGDEMNTKEFYRQLALRTELSNKDSKVVVDEMINLILETLPKEDIVLKNLGKFTVSKLNERKIKLKDEVIDAKSKYKPIFRPALELKWQVEDYGVRDEN